MSEGPKSFSMTPTLSMGEIDWERFPWWKKWLCLKWFKVTLY